MDSIRKVRIKYEDGSYSESIPIGVNSDDIIISSEGGTLTDNLIKINKNIQNIIINNNDKSNLINELTDKISEQESELINQRIFNEKQQKQIEDILLTGTNRDNPIYFGADPTGLIDSSSAIQKCLDENINKQITFTNGIYRLDKPIEISYNNQYGGINFNNSVLVNNTNNAFCIGVGTKNHNLGYSNSNDNQNRFYNIDNVKIKSSSNYAILIDRWFMNTRLNNIDILTDKNGIQIGKNYEGFDNTPSDVQLSNFIITNKNMNNNYEAISIIGTDNKFSDGRIYGFKTCINANGNLCHLNNIHFLACNFGSSILDNSYMCIKNAATLIAESCYCDSYPCFVQAKGDHGSINITNLFIYSWHSAMSEAALFDFSNINWGVKDLNCKNVRFEKSNYPNNTIIIKQPKNQECKGYFLNGFDSQDEIRVTEVDLLDNRYKDLAFSKNRPFINNYFQEWKNNWIPMGYINVINWGVCFINIYDDAFGLITYRIQFNTDLSVDSCTRLTSITGDWNPAIALKKIENGHYQILFSKNKDNIGQITTFTNNTIEMPKNSCAYITPITTDLYYSSAESVTNVDIISTNT